MKTKSFDAIEMKRRCQEEIRARTANQSDEARRRELETWLATGDDVLARLWRRASAGERGPKRREE